MTETKFYIDIGNDKIRDLALYDKNSFIAYSNKKEVITSDKKVFIEREIEYPIVRFINNEKFLLADTRTYDNQQNNAFIYDFNGGLLKSFLAGDGIQDVLIHNNKVIVTYCDLGVFGENGPNNNGLTIFDLDGKQEFGFNASVEGLHIYDCYSICKHDINKVLFYAYDFFNVIELSLDNFEWQEFKTPNDFETTHAITSSFDKIIFHSIYLGFLLWDRKKNEITKVGEYSSDLKGLADGKFLGFGEKGFTIIDVLN